jgi:membrane-anchored protein YejM (alkaline phosphatase superfamily)
MTRPNVLLITADSLRADRVDYSPSGRTPALARLAARGARFPRTYTVTPWTAPALVSIFSGLYPPTHGVVNRDDTTPKTLPTLPRLLGQNGYALVSYGFFTEVSYYRNLGLPKPPIDGAEVVGAGVLASWLRSRPAGPFFAWIHLTEPHLPYGASGYEAATANVRGSTGLERSQISATVPLGMGFTFQEGDREKLLALYDADVVRMDAALGSVLDALSTSGLAEETLVVFTADHAEELLEHGFVGHASTSGEATLTREVLEIPLVLAGPGVPAGLVSEALAQNVDVAPTVPPSRAYPAARPCRARRSCRPSAAAARSAIGCTSTRPRAGTSPRPSAAWSASRASATERASMPSGPAARRRRRTLSRPRSPRSSPAGRDNSFRPASAS